MSLTNTNTSAAIGPSDLSFPVASTTGFPAVGTYGSRQLMTVDSERMMVDYVPVSGTVRVLFRGYDGTVAMAHDTLAKVSTSSDPQDFGAVPAGFLDTQMPFIADRLTIGQDLTFTAAGTAPVSGTSLPLPIKNTIYNVTKASAAAITLISGTAAQAGVQITFFGTVAAANTVTYTPGFNGDTTSSDAATFAAKVGSTLTIECGPTGLWAVVGQNGITLG